MKINQITLYNFGSYEGKTIFDTSEKDGKNIILIGGKNGAGKTTLFTAMRICLYGYMSMGYKSKNSFYTKAITKLINNSVKISKPAESYVSIDISISNGQELDSYTLERKWTLAESLSEVFNVTKNDEILDEDNKADFEKYLLNIIPPELFNLYFFDGEKIADFFLEEGGNERIKDAFLTLCGYDTFDIMSKQFKRISSSSSDSSPLLDSFIEAKDNLDVKQEEYHILLDEHKQTIIQIKECDSELLALEDSYGKNGGISQKEWDDKLEIIKQEEKNREQANLWLKKMANEMIPFIMIRESISAVHSQIVNEEKLKKLHSFTEIVNNCEISSLLKSYCDDDIISKIIDIAQVKYGSDIMPTLNLSMEDNATVLNNITSILEFDIDKIFIIKKKIKSSIKKCEKIRKELERCNVDSVNLYMQQKAELLESKAELLDMQLHLEEELRLKEQELDDLNTSVTKMRCSLEEELKKQSINDISAKAIIMLDKLQSTLYKKQIERVEEFFRKEINILMRKTKFIQDIQIDNNFSIHLYRFEDVSVDKLISLFSKESKDEAVSTIGTAAFDQLAQLAGSIKPAQIISYLNKQRDEHISLKLEIDKTSFSNGEKQIFIMALYHSLVQLCNHEIPFVIDTPFARIDTQHRHNISKHFFSKLNGQVFILSTDEEIDSKHMQIMKDKILVTYILENTDNKRTNVIKNSYFEA